MKKRESSSPICKAPDWIPLREQLIRRFCEVIGSPAGIFIPHELHTEHYERLLQVLTIKRLQMAVEQAKTAELNDQRTDS